MIHGIFIGNELCDGRILNSNQQWIAEQLYSNGLFLNISKKVSDDETELKQCIKESISQAGVILCTGGLGPTEDDRTTEVIADALAIPCIKNDDVLDGIKHYFKRTNREMPKENEKQAYFPEGAHIIVNDRGTAPGFYIQTNTALVVCMPGVPREMKPMIQNCVIPLLKEKHSNLVTDHSVTLFKCIGKGESHCAELLKELYPLPKGLSISFQVKFPEIHIRLHVNKEIASERDSIHTQKVMTNLLQDLCFTQDINMTFQQHVIKLLIKQKRKISVAESCTGGLLSAFITAVPGSSEILDYSLVTYSNESKINMLGVRADTLHKYGAVSEEVAKEMAKHLKQQSGSDIAISITGIAGPDGGSESKPVGTVYVGIIIHDKVECLKLNLSGSRDMIRQNTVFKTMIVIYEKLKL